MTQFQPPPESPVGVSLPVYTPPPWSAAAIAGFVLSLLGCLGITALLGLVFGIVGTVSTRGGRRRGMGLAIAAIPISLVTGAFFVFSLIGVLVFGKGMAFVAQLPSVLDATPSEMGAAVSAVRRVASGDFNDSVSDETLEEWLKQVAAKHGRLAEIPTRSRVQPPPKPGKIALNLEGKFVNGRTNITVTFNIKGLELRLDDIEIDGVSPRDLN